MSPGPLVFVLWLFWPEPHYVGEHDFEVRVTGGWNHQLYFDRAPPETAFGDCMRAREIMLARLSSKADGRCLPEGTKPGSEFIEVME